MTESGAIQAIFSIIPVPRSKGFDIKPWKGETDLKSLQFIFLNPSLQN